MPLGDAQAQIDGIGRMADGNRPSQRRARRTQRQEWAKQQRALHPATEASFGFVNTPLPSPLLGNREGTPVFGHFDAPVGEIRADQHKFRSPMGGFVTEQERNEAFRSFQFIGVVGVDMAAGCAITHTSSGMSAFAYLWVNGTFTQLRLGGRAGDTVTFAADPDNGRTELSTSRGSAIMDAGPDGKRLTVTSPDLSINLTFQDEGVLRLCTPTGPTGWTYVQKVVAVPARGPRSWRVHLGRL